MAQYCTLIPYIKTQDGTLKESRLYNDLLSLTSRNRKTTNAAYNMLTDESFIETLDRKQIDELGEPILSSIIESPKLKSIIDETIIKAGLLNSLKAIDKNGIIYAVDTTDNYNSLASKVTEFNSTSPYRDNYIALVKNSSSGLFIDVVNRDEESESKAKRIATNLSLNNRIRDILSNSGITIGKLNELQDRLRSNGVVDYENATITAEGLIKLIKLADGIRGEEALPEEFAHLAFDMIEGEPLYNRLMTLLNNEELVRTILKDNYDSYKEAYNNDVERLKREAAGHLIFESWFNEKQILPKYTTLIGKVIDRIKQFINTYLRKQSIDEALVDSQRIATEIGIRSINSHSLEIKKLEELKKLSNLHHLENGAKTRKAILEKSIANSLKKYTFYSESLAQKIRKETNAEKKAALEDKLFLYKDKMNQFITDLKDKLDKEQFNEGIQNFILTSVSELNDAKTRLTSVISSNISLQEKAYYLRNIYNILNSIEPIADDISTSIQYSDTDLILSDETERALITILGACKQLRGQLNNETQNTFANFLKNFFPKEGVQIKGNTVTRDDILALVKRAKKDIGLVDTFLQSAANTDDLVISLADKAMKMSKGKVEQRTREIESELLAAAKELKDAGISDEFMFEKHEDGSLSGRYISEVNWTKYYDEKARFNEYLNNKYGNRRGEEYLNELRTWRKANETNVGAPNYKYYTNVVDTLTPIQKKYYDTFIKVREEMLSYLPLDTLNTDPMRAVQVSKDLWDKIKTSSPSQWYSEILNSAKESVTVKVDDTEFGYKSAIKGFNDEEILSVPIFFINQVDDKFLNRDTASTMVAFANMAINYDEMSKVSDLFEIGKEAMKIREAGAERNGKPLAETIRGVGLKVTQNINDSPNHNFVIRYNNFLETQLYNRFMKDETISIGEHNDLHLGKAAKLLNRVSSLNQLALNMLAGVAAVGSDMINVNSEVLASTITGSNSLFNAKQLWEADKIYRKGIVEVLGEFGNPIKTSKLGLFIQDFDVLHEYENEIRNIEWNRSKAKKLLSENSLYFFMQAGAHWGETRTALAQAQAIKIKSDDGTREESLWDILKVEYLDENDHSKGAKLVVKDGFTLTSESKIEYARKFQGLNQRLYGIYSKKDINALETTAIGQLVSLYRKFIIASLNRRYGSQKYNTDTGLVEEGYYRSAGRFLLNVIREGGNLAANIKMFWGDMSDMERSNCIRAINELGTFTVLTIFSSVLKGADWDDSNNPWQERFLTYMSARLKTETGAFTPIGVAGELWNILKSPAASINTVENLTNILKAVYPANWIGDESIVQHGRYKGHHKGYKYIMDSPFVPMNKTIYRAFHPEESIVAFTN